jgi:uncharacterized glyoxalase superfamily protein PhnB
MSNKAAANAILSPYITVQDVTKATQFYNKAFNFEILEINNDESGTPVHAEMLYKGQLIMCGKEGAYGGNLQSPKTSSTASPITLCIECENVDQFYTSAVGQGATSVSEPEDMFWGARMCRLADNDNYTWCFLTQK